jgi:hypothetical protein
MFAIRGVKKAIQRNILNTRITDNLRKKIIMEDNLNLIKRAMKPGSLKKKISAEKKKIDSLVSKDFDEILKGQKNLGKNIPQERRLLQSGVYIKQQRYASKGDRSAKNILGDRKKITDKKLRKLLDVKAKLAIDESLLKSDLIDQKTRRYIKKNLRTLNEKIRSRAFKLGILGYASGLSLSVSAGGDPNVSYKQRLKNIKDNPKDIAIAPLSLLYWEIMSDLGAPIGVLMGSTDEIAKIPYFGKIHTNVRDSQKEHGSLAGVVGLGGAALGASSTIVQELRKRLKNRVYRKRGLRWGTTRDLGWGKIK